jgi:hypothetical protein
MDSPENKPSLRRSMRARTKDKAGVRKQGSRQAGVEKTTSTTGTSRSRQQNHATTIQKKSKTSNNCSRTIARATAADQDTNKIAKAVAGTYVSNTAAKAEVSEIWLR